MEHFRFKYVRWATAGTLSREVLMPDGAFPFYIHGEKEKSHEILWICLNARWGISSLNTDSRSYRFWVYNRWAS